MIIRHRPSATRLLTLLVAMQPEQRREAVASQLAEMSGLSVKSVRRALKSLEDAGAIHTTWDRTGGRRGGTYTIWLTRNTDAILAMLQGGPTVEVKEDDPVLDSATIFHYLNLVDGAGTEAEVRVALGKMIDAWQRVGW